MFNTLTEKLTGIFSGLRNRGHLTEDDVNKSLREIRVALLEADVALPVAREFIKNIKEQAVGEKVLKSLKPGQVVIKIVHDELVKLLAQNDAPLATNHLPTVYMMAGLQGSGKTTTCGKLAHYLKKRDKKVLMVSVDVHRPAAIKQLEVLAGEVGGNFHTNTSDKPQDIAKQALKASKSGGFDALIVDTAGRLQIDDDMMQELKAVHQITSPHETLFVADAMLGQEAYSVAQGFQETVPLTGIILTRVDGDARGGAALSVKHVTNCPIKFMGVGEKFTDFEAFDAQRLADRILDKGDIVSLVEKTREAVSEEEAEKLAKKMQKGQFDLEDMASQLEKMNKMGGMSSLMWMLPGMGKIKEAMSNNVDDKAVNRQVGIIRSMTQKERKKPDILNGSRRKRIANGAGVHVHDVNRLLKQFQGMQSMMKRVKKLGGMGALMKGGLKGLFK